MNIKNLKRVIAASLSIAMLTLVGCHSGYSVVEIDGGRMTVTSELDKKPHAGAQQLLLTYKATVDSIMSPIIGESSKTMEGKRPESKLSNLLADILRNGATAHLGKPADIGVMNIGGIRSVLPAGEISYGDVFQVTPFENTLSLLEMDGKKLKELFVQIAANYGEGISGARLVITKKGELVSATVAGEPIQDEQIYTVATIDYIADGNNGMVACKDAISRVEPEDETIRKLFLDYVHQQTSEGKKIEAKVEGRITVKK
ncbi:MAG: 5'-nucleotidase C-terminal domain-containing protein [Phocaeicola sp.]